MSDELHARMCLVCELRPVTKRVIFSVSELTEMAPHAAMTLVCSQCGEALGSLMSQAKDLVLMNEQLQAIFALDGAPSESQ